MITAITVIAPRDGLGGSTDRVAYEMTALAAAHFSRYGFAYEELPKLRDAFLDVLIQR